MKNALLNLVMLLASVAVALGLAEAALRMKNADMRSYDIEMWRYALELKMRSDDPLLGHEHRPSRSAVLQSVDLRLNERGLRGGPVPAPAPGQRRILFLGSSVTLGWGVPEAETVTARVEAGLRSRGENAVVLNAGIGNYNAPRYVQRFLTRLTDLQPTDIVVHYFVRDAETLEVGGGSWLLRHSQLAATIWIAAERLIGPAGEQSLVEHYRAVYDPAQPGFGAMQAALERLATWARQNNVNLYFAMTPDVHDMVDYKLGFIHAQMKPIAQRLGFAYVDLLPPMRNLTPQELWSMPGDPHPNALGHKLMADAILPILERRH